ncbi:MAG: HlyD family efflux transporter periplasmic adaptor subunit [Chloroflexales bacterium]|nr:HlyD family efflux transporter periplasmic adaptor subunit [Chloroflexales bacterium]
MSVTSSAPRRGVLGQTSGSKRRRNPRWLAIPLGLAIALGGYGVWHYTQSNVAVTTTTTATVSRGTLSASVSGSGAVAAATSRALSFPVEGTVSEVLVSVGDSVTAGQPLARISTTELELALQQAQANLKSAEAGVAAASGEGATAEELAAAQSQLASAKAQYTQTVHGDVTAAELASAKAQLVSAQAALDALLDGPAVADLASAQASVTQAELTLQSERASLSAAKTKAESQVTTAANSLRDAQDSYATIYWQNRQLEKAPGELSQSAKDEEAAAQRAVSSAEESLRQAQLALEQAGQDEVIGIQQAESELASAKSDLETLQDGATDAEIASARASVASAQANLSALQEGASAEEITIAQASVEQAQISLNELTAPGSAATIASAEASLAQAQVAVTEAQLDLENATITAPFDGVVSAVAVSVGDTAGADATISVLDPTKLYVELSLSESDVADVAVGQSVELVFDALPDAAITGTVTSVAPMATVSSNVATYPARVSFDPGDQPIKVGMTASGTIITEEHADALLLPTRAIQTQGENQVVQVQESVGAAPVTLAVETGLSSDGQTEILSCVDTNTLCLQEGDTLVVTTASSGATSTSTGSSSGFGGLTGAGMGSPPSEVGR